MYLKYFSKHFCINVLTHCALEDEKVMNYFRSYIKLTFISFLFDLVNKGLIQARDLVQTAFVNFSVDILLSVSSIFSFFDVIKLTRHIINKIHSV